MQTWAAAQSIREVDLKEKEHPIIVGILRYLENTKYFDRPIWTNSIPSNEAYPHAPSPKQHISDSIETVAGHSQTMKKEL